MACFLGLDVGGTKIAAAVLDGDGTVLETATVPTPRGGDAVVGLIAGVVAAHAAARPLAGVGLAVPGDVDPATGVITSAPNIGWAGVDLAGRIAGLVPEAASIHVANDANAAAWAEYRFGGHRRGDAFAMITVGTGLGGGFVLNGRLLRGATGAAGEIGHLPLVAASDGEACPCGSRGCWERYASGTALRRAAVAAGWDGPAPSHEVLAAAGADPAARAVVDRVAQHLVRGISYLAAALNPETVILGGGLGTDPRFLAIAQEALDAVEVTRPRSRPTLEAATLGSLAGAIGAADLASVPEPAAA